ncbi:MAG: hypothetical protein K2M69_02100 [Muribaculaceae bacterium]|nr:hypothetical protein [Muribaculaceae bacterium]
MLTKFILHISGDTYELADTDLQNWEEIRCSYKRGNYDGVVRSFTSQFTFVAKARRILLDLYLKDRYNAEASISVHTLTDRWGWLERFRCPLDFSTASWNSHTFSLNALDNSLEAMIKSNKGTKYELVIGTDISASASMRFDRLPMKESATYKLTFGETFDDNPDIVVKFAKGGFVWIGNIGSEVAVNTSVHFLDDQKDTSDGYVIEAKKHTDVTLDFSLTWRTDVGEGLGGTNIIAEILRDGQIVSTIALAQVNRTSLKNYGIYTSSTSLPDVNSMVDKKEGYAVIGGIVWVCKEQHYYMGYTSRFVWESTGKTPETYFLMSRSGSVELSLQSGDKVRINHSIMGALEEYVTYRFTESEFVFRWKGIGDPEYINLIKPVDAATALLGKVSEGKEVAVSISDHDGRLASTWLMAAESARGLEEARFYSSFSEFCEWMSAVFGYVYVLEDNAVRFLHRSELFDTSAATKCISNCRDLTYNVDNSAIYSSVTVGYDKKDYNSVNGRDEFNFSNTYTTGCSVSDKTLSLISKYRADCYGIEFAVQKRGADSTDSDSDSDVFFVLCTDNGGQLVPDCSLKVENSLTPLVFNAAFSPMACARANAGLIGLQADLLTLTFASSTGNSDIVIDGEPITGNLVLDTPLATSGEIEFSTDDIDELPDLNELIEVEDDGMTYLGYLKEVDVTYAREEAAKYKLIVKEVWP